jgi:hypothetical protein
LFDQTAAFLLACGAQMLPDIEYAPVAAESLLV